MNKLLSQLEKVWQEHFPESFASMKSPFSEEQFNELEVLYKNELPVPVKNLFEWKGGQDALVSLDIFSDWRFMQFDEIYEEYRYLTELYDMGEFKSENRWRPQWVPFMVNNNGATLCYDPIGAFEEGRPGQIIFVVGDDTDRFIYFPDMNSLIEACIQCIITGEHFQFPEGFPKAYQA